MRVYLAALGCRLNEAELTVWRRELGADGIGVTSDIEAADVVVLNTCAVTTDAVRKSRKLASRLHRDNPLAQLVLTGCFATLEPDKAKTLAGVDMIVPNNEKNMLAARVKEAYWQGTAQAPRSTLPVLDDSLGGRTRAFIKVQDGCRNKCSFCIVTVARGQEVSRTIDDIVDEINDLERSGTDEAVLTGVHLGGYGHDLGTSLRVLVEEILARTTIPRLRLSSLEPWDLPDGFWQLWDNPRLMPHLHLPLQSGSDSVLRRMSRRCFTQDFARLVDDARAAIPQLNITTDLIVGFPGETESEFADSLAFVEQVGFGHVHVFPYSSREGTRAASLPDQLPKEVRKQRAHAMRALAERMKNETTQRAVGTTTQVLWETISQGQRRGYTKNYLRATMPASDNQAKLTDVTIVDATHETLIASAL